MLNTLTDSVSSEFPIRGDMAFSSVVPINVVIPHAKPILFTNVLFDTGALQGNYF